MVSSIGFTTVSFKKKAKIILITVKPANIAYKIYLLLNYIIKGLSIPAIFPNVEFSPNPSDLMGVG